MFVCSMVWFSLSYGIILELTILNKKEDAIQMVVVPYLLVHTLYIDVYYIFNFFFYINLRRWMIFKEKRDQKLKT